MKQGAAILNSDTLASSVDLRSDTVTRPTQAMYERMLSARIGDDGLDGDPTVGELEDLVATKLGKVAGLFVPSCTMANLLATLVQTQRQQQILLESTSHMYTSERGAATFTGAFYTSVSGTGGAMDLSLLEEALRFSGALQIALVCMETSHNNAGGTVLPIEHMEAVYRMASNRGIPVHLDGARLLNASAALDVPASEITLNCDTVSLCLSKGLSAPVGAVLAGSRSTIDCARAVRKMLGGTQRQAGIMAAAGIEAVQSMSARLGDDHNRARRLSEELNRVHPRLSATIPQTNIVQIDVSATGKDNVQWTEALQHEGVLLRPAGASRLRCVTHRHIVDADIDRAVDAFKSVAADFLS